MWMSTEDSQVALPQTIVHTTAAELTLSITSAVVMCPNLKCDQPGALSNAKFIFLLNALFFNNKAKSYKTHLHSRLA